MANLPKQVEQQLKEIEELEKAMQAPPETGEQTADPQPEPQADPVSESPSEAETPAEPAKEPPTEDWQAKYQTLNGKYNAEVPRLHQQNKDLAAQLAQLQAKVEELSAPKPQPVVEDPLVTDKDEAEFGSDLVDMVRRASKEATRDLKKDHAIEVSKLEAKIQQLESQLVNTSGDVTTLTFEQRLNRAVPDFEQLNVDPKWIAWLGEVDDLTGQPRRTYAEYVYGRGDVVEVKRIVDLYKSANAASGKQQEQQQRQKELNQQVQPSRNPSGQTAPQQAKIYSEAEAGRLFDRVRILNAQGKFDEAQSLEAELTHAYVQGRVRG